ncbi:MAG: hypothetical protein COA32_08110 [Fluviicola sp.]|nr:MAG: hypothetical protein COA32_08110 [Fluviicola sp.]
MFKSLLFIALSYSFTITSFAQQRNALKFNEAPFYHGVASGDPMHDRVIIWTRVTPDQANGAPIDVEWRITTDTSMYDVINSGTFTTTEDRDYTVKVDVSGLSPSTCYFYDFKVGDDYSVRGRTRTADLGDNELVRFAVVSCSNYEHGYFNAYKNIANRNDLNAILHLGDYIYEYEANGYSANISGRENTPEHEIISLEDYRLRYSHYRLDQDLKDLHQQYPFICVWDDHESANDAYIDGAENHDEATEGLWTSRKSNAKKSYFEWMPIRENGSDSSIYRKVEYGDLVNLYMLDTRLEGRDEQVGATSSDVNDPSRSLLGQTQLNWLKDELTNSDKQWNILGQQVMISPLEAFGVIMNPDQWDGYAPERGNLLNHVINSDIKNLVVLTGDIHTSWANDIPMNNYDAATGANSAGVEFVATSVTSPGFALGIGTSIIQSFNPHNKFVNLNKHGYIILDINKNRTQSEWYFLDDIETHNTNESLGNAYYVNDNERFLRQSTLTSVGYLNCIRAPELPYNIDNFLNVEENEAEENGTAVFGVYPNPFSTEITIHLGANEATDVSIEVVDISGKKVLTKKNIVIDNPSSYFKLYTSELSKGVYTINIYTNAMVRSYRIVKQ